MKKQYNNEINIQLLLSIIVFSFIFAFPSPLFATKVELPVPFSPQAPDGIWVEPWRNACEETSTALIEFYYFGHKGKNVKIADIKYKILELVRLENKTLGFNKDNNAREIAQMINDFLPWEAYVVKNPTLQQLKKEIDDGHPIIMPAHGRDLDNPHYKSDQIDYHVFVISGYDDDTQEFITQEVATRFGLDYRYTYDTIMNAMHDFLPNNQTYNGRRVAVFTRKEILTSGNTDADKDGLSKSDEIKYGTILRFYDSDGDGYTDGEEVKNGYSPTIPSNKVKNGDLVRVGKNPKIYLLQNDTSRHIANMDVMYRHGWDKQKIKKVEQKYLQNYFPPGKDITW